MSFAVGTVFIPIFLAQQLASPSAQANEAEADMPSLVLPRYNCRNFGQREEEKTSILIA